MKKTSKVLIAAIPAIIMIAVGLLIFKACGDDKIPVYFVLEKDGKKYVYHETEFFLQNDLKRGDTPRLTPTGVYQIKGELYIQPDEVEAVAAIASGAYKFYEYEAPSHDGFVVSSEAFPNYFNKSNKSQPTEEIGKSQLVYEINLIGKDQTQKRISWIRGEDKEALENCITEYVMVVYNPYPGKTVGNYEKAILVKINDIFDFYNNSIKMNYDKDKGLLIFSEE